MLPYNIWGRLNLNDWNEYIRLSLVSVHGQDMLQQWWKRASKIFLIINSLWMMK
ncbi:hypothetical protein COO91_09767 (plasmid) [Nostoc flagelliforme CCNUN1]|uniref:Uncharacterized protein n=1 Tax=Nostoc flagelliforme CCNUN1 TaxID=2038116 RepID=A0A2K8T7A9_9NOSO|nr:hypothetical protein COO91_08046 [Nostoc flagelliforme CCNUN1]AUB42163.1 hypothetical protein COO91_08270 [Nostoc flagelliforme CCNUN1]AUB43586.1 hypothetical protein COO91_09767 [Nostoc flagelliforme CCNUN1]